MAKLKTLLDAIDGLIETDQAHYTKITEGPLAGKFLLAAEPVSGQGTDGKKFSFAIEDVGGMRTSLEDRRAKHEAAKTLLEGLRDSDGKLPDLTEIAALRTKITTMDGMVDKDKVEALVKERMVEHQKKFDKELAGSNTALTESKKQLSNVVVRGAAIAAIAEHKGNQELLLPHVMRRLGISEKGDMPMAFVKGENDNARISLKPGAGHDDLMQPDELVEEMKGQDVFSSAFDGSGNSGTGSNSTSSSSGAGGGGVVKLSREDARDPVKYQAAKKEAADRKVQLVTD